MSLSSHISACVVSVRYAVLCLIRRQTHSLLYAVLYSTVTSTKCTTYRSLDINILHTSLLVSLLPLFFYLIYRTK